MMIYEHNKDAVRVEVNGTLYDTLFEVFYLISQIYHRLPAPMNDLFKHYIQRMIEDNSPAWDKKTMVKGQVEHFAGVDVAELLKQMKELQHDES